VSWVSWVLIVAGWVVVNHQNNKRETRKEVRASLLEVYKLLDEIEDAAYEYHSTDGDAGKARKIVRAIQQIAPRIIMARRGPIKFKYTKALADFRRAITFSNFDTSAFERKRPEDPFFDQIAAAKRELITALEQAYAQAYP
jgi:hypothetical protein